MSVLRSIYDQSPVPLQNLLTSVYGYQLHALRYGGAYKRHLEQLDQSQWWPRERLHTLQLDYLRRLLIHAYEHVEFYRERFRQADFHPSKLKSAEDLLKLPILTREDVLQNAERMVADNCSRSRLRQHFTSGTTGTPLRFYENKDTIRRNYAFWMRFRRWFGFREWLPRATFGGRVVVPRGQNRPPYWRYNYAEKQMVFSSFHLSEETLPAYIERLERFTPFLIDGYVSTIFTLARYINRQGITTVRPSAVQTTSETLFDFQRREIEEAFQCKVYNQYGQGEKVAFISECEHGQLHVNDEYGIVEIVKDGLLARPGEAGEIIATSFNNWVMPLIRYQTGDLAVASAACSCPCGRGLSVVESIEGRVIDILRMPDGKMVPPTALTLLFDKASAMGIDRAQVCQVAHDQIVVKLVPRNSEVLPDTSALENDLRMMMGDKVRIRFEMVAHIPNTEAGKFKFVVSELPR